MPAAEVFGGQGLLGEGISQKLKHAFGTERACARSCQAELAFARPLPPRAPDQRNPRRPQNSQNPKRVHVLVCPEPFEVGNRRENLVQFSERAWCFPPLTSAFRASTPEKHE